MLGRGALNVVYQKMGKSKYSSAKGKKKPSLPKLRKNYA